jgi:diguanylate cyclase (GGDEF)-like protein
MLPGDRDAVAVALLDRDALLAVAYASSSREPLIDRAAVVSLLEHVGPAYAVARERERDRRAATFDGLTGLLTPRAFRNELHAYVARARLSEGLHATIWFIDTDEFKRINDTLGHAAGDVVLQAMAKLLRDHAVRARDVAARNGGDEFLLLLRDTPKSRAVERAQAFCRAVRHHDFGIGRSISASVGVASYPLDARSSSGLLELADAAMYHSKNSGRGRASFVNSAGQFSVCGE